MRFRRHTHAVEETGIDLAPMLDFFLNLLIFFIISTAFVSESGVQINRPTAKTATAQKRSAIYIGITPAGEVFLDKQATDLRLLRGRIQKLHAEHPEAAVIIQADQDARAGLVIEALDQVKLAGIDNVAVAAKP
jgi:biopolymer transport protein ExbD